MNPNFLHSFEKTLQNLQQSHSLVDDASRIVYRKVVQDVDNQKIINLSELLQLSNYQAYLYQWLSPFGFSAWNDIYDLVKASSGKQIFSEHFRLLKDRETLIVEPIIEKQVEEYWISSDEKEIIFPIHLQFSSVESLSQSHSNVIFLDRDTLKFPLLLRKWQKGDYFYPFGMKGKKKLSKFFKDEKFSLIEKENQWILCSDNQIVWLLGKRMDDRFKLTQNTQTTLKIELIE